MELVGEDRKTRCVLGRKLIFEDRKIEPGGKYSPPSKPSSLPNLPGDEYERLDKTTATYHHHPGSQTGGCPSRSLPEIHADSNITGDELFVQRIEGRIRSAVQYSRYSKVPKQFPGSFELLA